MLSVLRPAITLLGLLTAITGVAYPLAVTGAAQVAFPAQANGSLQVLNGHAVGSTLIGQHFDSPSYFWGRPSATGPSPYNGAASTGSNLGPTNPALQTAVHDRVKTLREAQPGQALLPVPVDLVTTSGSGLDPHISPAAALYQVERIAQHRKLPEQRVRALVVAHIEGRTLGFLGEPQVNVLLLNLALDELTQQ
jgi:potassium-transporting ATPase KdpC subunit